MSACCTPFCGRASTLFSTWMIRGAPEPIWFGSPCEGTSMMVVNVNFQAAANGSSLVFTAVCAIESW